MSRPYTVSWNGSWIKKELPEFTEQQYLILDTAWKMYQKFLGPGIQLSGCGCCGSPTVTFEGYEFDSVNIGKESIEFRYRDLSDQALLLKSAS